MSARKVFDLESTLDRVENDKSLLVELLDIFDEDYSTQLETVLNAINRGDATELGKSAHAIKSGLGNLGAMTAFDLAFELEKIGKTGNTSNAKSVYERLAAEIEKFRTAAAEFRKTVN